MAINAKNICLKTQWKISLCNILLEKKTYFYVYVSISHVAILQAIYEKQGFKYPGGARDSAIRKCAADVNTYDATFEMLYILSFFSLLSTQKVPLNILQLFMLQLLIFLPTSYHASVTDTISIKRSVYAENGCWSSSVSYPTYTSLKSCHRLCRSLLEAKLVSLAR